MHVLVSGVPDASFNGTFVVTGVSGLTFTYVQSGLSNARSGGGGTVIGVPPPPNVQIAKIKQQITGGIQLQPQSGIGTFSAPNTLTSDQNAQVAWGHDDTTAINSLIGTGYCLLAKIGCKLYFPPGSYWVQGPEGIKIGTSTAAQALFFLQGAGAASARGFGVGPENQFGATSEIVVADASYALTVGATQGANYDTNGGPRISNLGFRDVSGAGNALGGIHFIRLAHAFLDNDSFIDFANGAGIFFDEAGSSTFAQYNFILDPTILYTKNPILFGVGKASSNWIVGGNITGSQVGGGACIDFQGNAGSSSGGQNYILYPQCNYFPIAFHAKDQNADHIFIHAENSAPTTSDPNVIGSNGSGTGLMLEGTSGGNCADDQIAESSFTSFGTMVNIGANCTHVSITSPVYSGPFTHLVDNGTDTQTTGAETDVQNLVFPGSGSSMAQYFTKGATVMANNLQCFSGTATVADCPTSAKNFIGIAITSNDPVPVQVAGTALVNLDNSPTVTPTAGDVICSSGTVAGQLHENSTNGCPTPPGRQVGIVARTESGPSSTALIFLQKN